MQQQILTKREALSVSRAFCEAHKTFARLKLRTDGYTIEEIESGAIIIATNAKVTVEVHQNADAFRTAYGLNDCEAENEHF